MRVFGSWFARELLANTPGFAATSTVRTEPIFTSGNALSARMVLLVFKFLQSNIARNAANTRLGDHKT